MKTILVLISKLSQLNIINLNSIPSNTHSNVNFILLINESLKEQLNQDMLCYFDQIIYTPTNQVNDNEIIYIENILHDKIKKVCSEFSHIYAFVPDETNLDLVEKILSQYNIPTWNKSTAKLCRDKVLMKQHMLKHNIRVPRFMKYSDKLSFEHIQKTVGLPFVIKPISSFASIGVYIIRNEDEYKSFLNISDKNLVYEAEEYICGELYHIDTVKYNEKFYVTVARYSYPMAEALNGRIVSSLEILPDDPLYQQLITFNRNVVDSFDNNGCFHNEVFINKNGEAIFLEIGWRQAGAPCECIFTQHFGISQTALYIMLHLNNQIVRPSLSNGPYRLEFILPKKVGKYSGVNLPKTHGKAVIQDLIAVNTIVGSNAANYAESCAKITIKYPTYLDNYSFIKQDFELLCKRDLRCE